MINARLRYKRLRIEDGKRKEADRIHLEEEEILRKQMNSKRAKEEAERLHRVSAACVFYKTEQAVAASLFIKCFK